ncbi:hypothetical protein TH47_08675 [Thalassospira sp. MCCC 1A02803]|nr:hypothetical protein TH47_08675 [Thalassospira sp. MCCC 1A02803]
MMFLIVTIFAGARVASVGFNCIKTDVIFRIWCAEKQVLDNCAFIQGLDVSGDTGR